MKSTPNRARWLNNTLTLGSIFALAYFLLYIGMRAWEFPAVVGWWSNDDIFIDALWFLPLPYAAGAILSWRLERRHHGRNPDA